MCGIIGYIGKEDSLPILIKGLKALEYRGYDSAGVVVLVDNKFEISKSVGQVKELEKLLKNKKSLDSHIGIGHTRWATHGAPSKSNSHPHYDCLNRVFVVHNGIIENYKELKRYLKKNGHKFKSETDTEIIPHLIESFLKKGKDFETALFYTLELIKGTYALAVIDVNNPEILYAAKLSSPLVIGVGNNENFLASDSSALMVEQKMSYILMMGK